MAKLNSGSSRARKPVTLSYACRMHIGFFTIQDDIPTANSYRPDEVTIDSLTLYRSPSHLNLPASRPDWRLVLFPDCYDELVVINNTL